MSMVKDGEYLGLPVPDNSEYEKVTADLISASQADEFFTPEDIYNLVCEKRHGIELLLYLELDYFRAEDAPEYMSREEVEVHVEGIQAGYKFMIGCLTYMYYLRSGKDSIFNFIDQAPKRTPALPLRKVSQFRQAAYTSAGTANVDDYVLAGIADDSSYLASIDAEKYFKHAIGTEILLVDAIDDIFTKAREEGADEDLADNFADGFRQGAETAIGMYIQSYIQEQINISGVSHIINNTEKSQIE